MLQPYQLKQHAAMRKKQGDPLLGALGTMAGTAAGAAIGGPAGAAIGGSLGSQLGNVASGAPIDPAQMAITGLGSGMSAGSSAAKTAVEGVTSAQEGVLSASNALDSALDSAVGDQATAAAQSGYDEAIKKLQDAGMKSMEAESSLFNKPFSKAGTAIKSVFMSQGGQVNPNEERKKRLAMLSPLMAAASSNNPLSLISPLAALTLSEGGKAKGPLCSECEAQYKACGGMTKKY